MPWGRHRRLCPKSGGEAFSLRLEPGKAFEVGWGGVGEGDEGQVARRQWDERAGGNGKGSLFSELQESLSIPPSVLLFVTFSPLN